MADATKRAMVIGGADCVWRDVDAALTLSDFDAVYACNEAGVLWEGLTAWCTLHPDKLGEWLRMRRAKGYPDPDRVISYEQKEHVTRVLPYLLPGQKKSASSGVYCAIAAMLEGYDKIVLCGVPLTVTPHFSRDGLWKAAEGPTFRRGFMQALPALSHCVRSMSGWSQENLGEPTSEWLARPSSIDNHVTLGEGHWSGSGLSDTSIGSRPRRRAGP